MADVADNLTARLWLDYTSLGRTHHMLFRPAANLSAGERASMAETLANVIALRMRAEDSVFAARYSEANSNFSIPVELEPVNGAVTAGATVWSVDPESATLNIVARSLTTGKQVRYTLFTGVAVGSWPANNRYEPGESAVIDTWRENMTTVIEDGALGTIPLVTADGTFATVYQYVNTSLSAYWQRKQRRGG